jgi:SpoVK/Ycf46/Vps4 family AAA+-type ATPase
MQDINTILNRTEVENEVKDILNNFNKEMNNVNFKKGIYIYGAPGSGKTTFITNILKELNYDIIKYDAGDVRNKNLIETITNNNISNRNVLDLMNRKQKKIAIVMDEIDGMNNGDKGGLTALIKLIRQKKTKKQKQEDKTMNPIICIGNYIIDKKIRELIKVCNTYEIKTPSKEQSMLLLNNLLPTYSSEHEMINNYIQGDLRKLELVFNLINKSNQKLPVNKLIELFCKKSYNEDAKQITKLLINSPIPLNEHNFFMNETDRTIVALLWHENIIDMLQKHSNDKTIPIYSKILDHICFADYIDRITFQNQIWQFNEMSSLIKTFYTNKMYHDYLPENKNQYNPEEVRFTKVLTKYSTEYNNILFIYDLSQELDLDKSDLISLFQEIRLYYDKENINSVEILNHLETFFQDYDISKLDIKRLYRYLDKNSKKDLEIDE